MNGNVNAAVESFGLIGKIDDHPIRKQSEGYETKTARQKSSIGGSTFTRQKSPAGMTVLSGINLKQNLLLNTKTECGYKLKQHNPHFLNNHHRMIVFFTECFSRGYPKYTCQIMFQKASI